MINQFRGDFYFLSNMYECDIEFNKNKFKSIEHAYIYHKYDNIEIKKLALSDIDGKVLKIESKRFKKVKGWDDIKLKLMYELLKVKFNKTPFKEMLISTNDCNIVEGNSWNDTFWGVDITQTPNIGENHLGRLIMKVRDELLGLNRNKKSIFI